jgi:hypothetical protein
MRAKSCATVPRRSHARTIGLTTGARVMPLQLVDAAGDIHVRGGTISSLIESFAGNTTFAARKM